MTDIHAHLFAPREANPVAFNGVVGSSSAIHAFDLGPNWGSHGQQSNLNYGVANVAKHHTFDFSSGKEAHLLNVQVLSNLNVAVVGHGNVWCQYIDHLTQSINAHVFVDATQTIPPALHANWLELARSGLSDVAFERLRTLAAKKDGWRGENSKSLMAGSLNSLLVFWRSIKSMANEPELMLTPKGTLQAEWHRSHRQFLDVEFRANGRDVNFGLFDRGHTLEGTMSLADVRATVVNYRNGLAFGWGS